MRNPNLEIPIRVNDAKRTEIKELELHVSTDQGRTWTLAGRAKPEQQAFGFHASGDGLYWFSVCAIDKTGRRDPEDIATAKPALKVLIDTTHPALAGRRGGPRRRGNPGGLGMQRQPGRPGEPAAGIPAGRGRADRRLDAGGGPAAD